MSSWCFDGKFEASEVLRCDANLEIRCYLLRPQIPISQEASVISGPVTSTIASIQPAEFNIDRGEYHTNLSRFRHIRLAQGCLPSS